MTAQSSPTVLIPTVPAADKPPLSNNQNQKPGNASLPTPNGTLTYITLGRGTQNYSRVSSNSSSVPVNLGGTIRRHISGPLPKKLSGTFDVDLRIRLTLSLSLSLSPRLFPSYLCTA